MSTTTTTSSTTNTGTTFGALKYNLNSMLGWRLGTPSASDMVLYSDLVLMSNNGQWVLFDFQNGSLANPLFTQFSTTYSDQTLVTAASTGLGGANDLMQTKMTASDYESMFASADGLFGLSWLPWNPYGLLATDGSGNYNVKQYVIGNATDITSYVTCNPLRREVLEIKLFTILKLFGIGLGTYLLIKLGIRYADK